jgi:hypothetical protein
VTAPDPGAEQGRPSRETITRLLDTGVLSPCITRFDGTFVVAQYRHECSDLVWNPTDGHKTWYQQTIPLGSYCTRCGWSADLPLPSVDACAEQIVAVMGADDGLVFAELLAERLRGAR